MSCPVEDCEAEALVSAVVPPHLAVDHGFCEAAAKPGVPDQGKFSSVSRFPMWLQTEPSRTPLYIATRYPASSTCATTGVDGFAKSESRLSETGPDSSACTHVCSPT